ncbi:bifunctional demethylmenaquinone methyltransferase/2-methoxy-6-polyprenyl-1,4-benzoquinol methylase UbiE [Candidatus Pseudomonas adelgestsugas]|nr:bifunctional demethylmenaquinone methyltransferase/2-methoxy-6-polyprenyl-1,4-benzoquinol methylase UbiE [Candidatus Pseudomonas adelgestsugas]
MDDQYKSSSCVEPATHFGFKSVPESQKAANVAKVFNSVAAKYDLMNDVLSGGMHRLWKRFTIELSGVRTGNRVLDIAGGTGDLAAKFSRLVGPTGQVALVDINSSMLRIGRDRLLDKGVSGNIKFIQADAEKLPFLDNYFDCVTIAFGLRNVTHKEDAIRSMLRVLKPGGRLLVLDFSKPTNALIAKVYNTYSFTLIPLLGKMITNDADSYRYLTESIRMHPDQETLKLMIVKAGFYRASYHNITSGIVALHRGIKP